MNNDDDISTNFVWLAAFLLFAVFLSAPGWGTFLAVFLVLYLMLIITNTMAREENKVLRQARKRLYRKHSRDHNNEV